MIKRSLLTKLMATMTIAMLLIAIIVAAVNYNIASSRLQKGFDNDKAAMIELNSHRGQVKARNIRGPTHGGNDERGLRAVDGIIL